MAKVIMTDLVENYNERSRQMKIIQNEKYRIFLSLKGGENNAKNSANEVLKLS